MDTENLKNFLQELDCELTADELAVISCLRDHLIDYMPNYINPEQFYSEPLLAYLLTF